jgi:hypothetical protein
LQKKRKKTAGVAVPDALPDALPAALLSTAEAVPAASTNLFWKRRSM